MKYILDLLKETSVTGCRPADTPNEFNAKLRDSVGKVPVDKERYRCLVGKLIYLFHTRQDISYVVRIVSQFMQLGRTYGSCESVSEMFEKLSK